MFRKAGNNTQSGTEVDFSPQQLATKFVFVDVPGELRQIVADLLRPEINVFLNQQRHLFSLGVVNQTTVSGSSPRGRYMLKINGVHSTLFVHGSQDLLRLAQILKVMIPSPCVVMHWFDYSSSYQGSDNQSATTEYYTLRVNLHNSWLGTYEYGPIVSPYGSWSNQPSLQTVPTPSYHQLDMTFRVGWRYGVDDYSLYGQQQYRYGVGHRLFYNLTVDELNRFIGDGQIWYTSLDLQRFKDEFIKFYESGTQFVDHTVTTQGVSIDFRAAHVMTAVPISPAPADWPANNLRRSLFSVALTAGWRTRSGLFVPARRPVYWIDYIDYFDPEYSETNYVTQQTTVYPATWSVGWFRFSGLNYWQAYKQAFNPGPDEFTNLQYAGDTLDVAPQCLIECVTAEMQAANVSAKILNKTVVKTIIQMIRPDMADTASELLAYVNGYRA